MRLVPYVLCLSLLAIGRAFANVPFCESDDGQWRAEITKGTLIISKAGPNGAAFLPMSSRILDSRKHILSPAASIVYLAPQEAFLVAPSAAPELWLIALREDAGPYYDGFVHSYIGGMEESLASEEGRFARLRIDLEAPVAALQTTDDPRAVEGVRADGTCVRIHIIARREIGNCADFHKKQE